MRKSYSGTLIGARPLTRPIAYILSHAHWDHCRPVRKIFPKATGYFGPGTWEHCGPGHLHHGGAIHPDAQYDGRFFDPKHATERATQFEGPWVKFGPFDKATDFFGDGSLWVIQAPGHLAGNLAAAAHLGDGKWVLLGGDCCHSRALFDRTVEFGLFDKPDGSRVTVHEDLPAAKDTLAKLRILESQHGMHLALGHDDSWMREGKDEVLMSLLDDEMRDFVSNRLPSNGLP